jgi:hypothetical protein
VARDLLLLRAVAREVFQRDSLVSNAVRGNDREPAAESGRKPAIDGEPSKPFVMADRSNDVNTVGVDRHFGECATIGEYRSWLEEEFTNCRLPNMGYGNTYRNAGKSEAANLACFVGAGRKDSDARRQHGAANLEEGRLARHGSTP